MRYALILSLLSWLLPLPVHGAEGDTQAGRIKAYTCTGCHGIEGYNNVYPTYKVPRIGGQNSVYLESALKAYQGEDRIHRTMSLHAQSLSDGDIADIAAWLASLAPADHERDAGAEPPPAAQACQACHGADGMGTDPAYPALAGQHRSYLSKALQDYRSGARGNPIMRNFAASLSDQDIEALSAWYAGLEGLRDLSGQ
ncbi:MAG TPA: c-type cytochrome [Xanthomonadales bacterium]|nr:c-type cytochrome [Xanthomonadales bacterium]